MSKIDQIQTFVQVIDKNGFAAAGRSLGISKAAVSKQISMLEMELKIKLLHRTTRKLVLTDAGAIYYEHCQKLLESIRDMDNLISAIQREPAGKLHIVSGRHFAERYIIPYLGEYMKLFPKVKVFLELAERIPDLEREPIDLILGMSVTGPPEAIQKKIMMTRYKLCASPSYLKKYGTPMHPQDLQNHSYITHGMRKPDNILRFNQGQEVFLEPILHLNDANAMLACAIQGLGIVKLHDYVVEEALKQNLLKEILPQYAENEIPIYYMFKSTPYIQPKIRTFIDFVMEKTKESNK